MWETHAALTVTDETLSRETALRAPLPLTFPETALEMTKDFSFGAGGRLCCGNPGTQATRVKDEFGTCPTLSQQTEFSVQNTGGREIRRIKTVAVNLAKTTAAVREFTGINID